MSVKVLGIVNFHSSPDITPLTDSRPIGSTSFLGRYALCDFALSNLCNSEISTVGLLVKDHPRSILKHLGAMDSWVSNTKIGSSLLMYNEPAHKFPDLNTDVNNIKENDWVLYDNNPEVLVFLPAHVVCSIDLRPIIEEHVSRGEKITVVATEVGDASTEFTNDWILTPDEDGYVASARRNDASLPGKALVSTGIVVLNREVMKEIAYRLLPEHPEEDLGYFIDEIGKSYAYRRHLYIHKGYIRCIDSFRHYLDYSFELLNEGAAHGLFNDDWPIYTVTHDTPPASYGEESEVSESFISNGSIIEGTVIHSIIGRHVRVGKGAVVKNSIIFTNARIGEGAVVENALMDKYTTVSPKRKLVGKEHAPVYLKQGDVL